MKYTRNDLIGLIHECFTQACWIEKEKKYDHLCISTWEEAQYLLIREGCIKKKDCYRL